MALSSRLPFLAMFALLCCAACNGTDRSIERALQAGGLTDGPSPQRIMVDLLIDVSPGSPSSPEAVGAALDGVVPPVAARPGSSLRLWSLGETLESTRLLATETSTPPARPSKAIVEAHKARFVREASPRLVAAIKPFLGGHERTSPIAEGITRVALETTPPNVKRHLIVITDARQVSDLGDGGPLVDFECGRLPTAADFVQRLHRARLLTPGLLTGVHVTLCFVRPDAVEGNRCRVSLARYQQILSLWGAALESSGAIAKIVTGKPPAFAKGEGQ